MAGPLYAYVPIDALRALVEYADGERICADEGAGLGPAARTASDTEFRELVAALGVPALLPDEVGAG
jgi:hypothetical protein